MARGAVKRWAGLGVVLFLSVFVLGGCSVVRSSAKAMEPEEATFADPQTVMLRGIEEASFRAEYWDPAAKAVKVKRFVVRPPFWVVNEAMLRSRVSGWHNEE